MTGIENDRVACRIIEVDGQPVRIRDTGDTSAEYAAAIEEVVRAAHRKLASMPPGPLSIACPRCGRKPGELCQGRTANVGPVHPERREALKLTLNQPSTQPEGS